MKLQNNTEWTGILAEYLCDLTNELDALANFDKDSYRYHYIIADDHCIKTKCLAIRVPGGTVGGIRFDDNNIITKIDIDTEYVVDSYPQNVNYLIQKYIGEKLEWK